MKVRHLFVAAALPLALSAPQATPAETPLRVNGRIAFSEATGIVSVNPDGSGAWSIELGPGDGDPAWAPDGDRLVVRSVWPGNEGLVVMDPDGSEAQRITTSPDDRQPAWSPDGSWIAFVSGGDLELIRPDGSDRRRLANSPGWELRPTWSPDGSRLVFAGGSEGDDSDLYAIEVSTGRVTKFLDLAGWEQGPAWSPEGREIAFSSDLGGEFAVYAVRPDGSGLRLIARGGHADAAPAWSPDGSQLAFNRNGQIWVVARDGGSERLIASSPTYLGAPAWQPVAPTGVSCTHTGTSGNDVLVGTRSDDILCGGEGDDTVLGMEGHDVADGGAGRDWLAGGPGHDRLWGGTGGDRIDSRDGGYDAVLAGGGRDLALLDAGDVRVGVERRRIDGNIAAWRPARASGSALTNPPVRAVDGRADDWWNSSGHPPQWIEIDLGRPTDIAWLRLVAGAQPAGVRHLVLGKGPNTGGAYRLLRTLAQPTAAFQELLLKPKRPWRAIRYLRIETTRAGGASGWVSWHEIEAYAPTPPRRTLRR